MYKNEEYKKELLQKEKDGYFDDIKIKVFYEEWIKSNKKFFESEEKSKERYKKEYENAFEKKLIESLLPKLLKKDIYGAFPGLELEKIYDIRWGKKKQDEEIKFLQPK